MNDIAIKTRADLLKHPLFANLYRDTSGNPCVWMNSYCCQACTSEQVDWCDEWSCQCDDECPNCGASVSPVGSDWIGPDDPIARALWELLPEAGSKGPLDLQWTSDDLAATINLAAAPLDFNKIDDAAIEALREAGFYAGPWDEAESEPALTPALRAERLLSALSYLYEFDEPHIVIADALVDLRHACDLHDLSFSNHDRTAQQNYAAERLADIQGDEGPILIETEGGEPQ